MFQLDLERRNFQLRYEQLAGEKGDDSHLPLVQDRVTTHGYRKISNQDFLASILHSRSENK